VAARIVEGCDGVVRGKSALRNYWRDGLSRIPALRFELLGVYVGVDTIVINYRNQHGGLVSEVLRFDGLSWWRGTELISGKTRSWRLAQIGSRLRL
jgi:hypothetical protein